MIHGAERMLSSPDHTVMLEQTVQCGTPCPFVKEDTIDIQE